MRRSIHVASWAGWLLLLTPSLNAQSLRPEAAIALQNELRRIVRESSPSEALGVAVSDAVTGQDIFSHNAHIHRNPASNMKLVTAAGVLKHLGPNFKIRTALYGRIDDSGNVDVLVLRGQGDPSLSMSDFTELAAQIRYRGVRRVRKVIVDGSYFDDQRLPPAFEQQPNEVSAFRAPVAAVTLERSSFLLRVRPSLSAGDTAVATLVPSGYFDVENQITTTADGSPNIIAIQRDAGRQLSLKLRGSIPISSRRGVAYRRRVANPLSYAAFGMVEALQRVGIRTDGLVETRKVDDPLPMLASRQSPSVATLLQRVGKLSDNFYAEMLLKVMAAEHAAP
ncbi:MAG: D-alanyl-D-alanine carboxypeptidase/D-alanyl-D-alanine-endopeptidase, partial [Myxococcota bacterium]